MDFNKNQKNINRILGELEGCYKILKHVDPSTISDQINWDGLLKIIQQTIDFLENEGKK